MAKKILAVVLAVMVAVSAMAITAFADETIDLAGVIYGTYDSPVVNGPVPAAPNGTNSKTTTTFTVTASVNLYGFAGYMDSNHYMVITTPDADWNVPAGTEINWTLWVNGTPYTLGKGTASANVLANRVNFGYATHSFAPGYDTTIPQSTGYLDTTTIRLVGTFTVSKADADNVAKDILNKDKGNTQYNVTFYNSDDNTVVNNSVAFLYENATVTPADTTNTTNFAFVNDEWTKDYDNVTNVISLDHTLKNRSLLASATDGAELHIELDNPIVGEATYTLWASKIFGAGLAGSNNLFWWQNGSARTYVGQVKVEGKTSELVFNVPYGVLYDANYGLMVDEFIVYENINLLNSTIMSDYLTASGNWSDKSPVFGKIQRNGNGTVSYDVGGSFEQLRYAAGGATDSFTGYPYQAPVRAAKMYLVIPTGEDEDVETPQESADTEEEDETVNEPAPEVDAEPEPEPEPTPAPADDDANPGTGIALAVVPMLVAAAAAVVSKKH